MKHLFVNFETALKLKELGFDEECFGWWHICNSKELRYFFDKEYFLVIKQNWNSECIVINAPIYQQVIDWLREKHNLVIVHDLQAGTSMHYNASEEHFQFNVIKINDCKTKNALHPMHNGKSFNTYYDGLNFVIEETLKLIKK